METPIAYKDYDMDMLVQFDSIREMLITQTAKAISAEAENWQKNKTPYTIVDQMIEKTSLDVETILVMFNVEFVERMIHKYEVPPEKIFFFADHYMEQLLVEKLYGVRSITGSKNLMSKEEARKYKDIHPLVARIQEMGQKKFDLVLSNPPYQFPKEIVGKKKGTVGGDSWSKILESSVELCKDGGSLVFIHPPLWRKPEHRIWDLLTKYQIEYLEIHSKRMAIKLLVRRQDTIGTY